MRPVGVLATVVLVAAACRGAAVGGAPIAGDRPGHAWPMFRGDAAHGGDRPAAPTPTWRIAWRAELGARIDASPLVLAGGVLIATRTGVVVLLDAATGAERARAALGGDVWATPAAAGDVIVVGVRRRQGGELVGLGARDLAVRWRRAVAEGGFGAATAVDGVVWLCNGAALVALAPATGREQARIALGDRCYGAPAAGGAAIVVATRDGQVRGFVGGRTVDRGATSAGADNDTAPVIAGERVLLGSNDHWLYALGARGEPRIPHILSGVPERRARCEPGVEGPARRSAGAKTLGVCPSTSRCALRSGTPEKVKCFRSHGEL